MGHDALKLELIEWLTKLKDDDTIKYLKVIKNSLESEDDWWNDLTKEQKKGIERGLRDIQNGKVVVHEDVAKKYGL